MSTDTQRLKVLSAGIFSLILMLGIGRFAYTPLLPVMQQQQVLGIAEGGWLAAINYGGYLCGAILAAMIGDLVVKDRLYRGSLVLALLTTVGMGLTENIWLWAVLRFFAGLASAGGLLIGSGLILNWLIRHGHRSELGIHISGMGLGISLCALAVELMSPWFDWRGQWLLFSLIGGLILIPAWRWLPSPDRSQLNHNGPQMQDNPPGRLFLRLFMAAYFCAGVGYAVSATFIVAIVEQLPGQAGNGALAFIVVGVAAAPACILWDLIARRIGNINALSSAYLLQILSLLLPVMIPGLSTSLIGAALFGATFIGIVSLVLTMAGRYYPSRPARMMGVMTISYGIAQIIAPALTGLLAEHYGSYDAAIWLAIIMMAAGSLLTLPLGILERRKRQPRGTSTAALRATT
ncbi:YbfB/YjiJ family MFS transporter [Marinobacterium jannaschii]|uniref:YbfB/YjiJ family MFS transporter n=1 Tax=Marinobacterium jannaschii TaxID=64970 RepID=UPI0004872CBF|nr:YbfB/YjiJ family MFS transporter [Marinobacterium jannaschii]